ncbi:hypothetical protein CEXT_12371 [Caerostris extrusa]|uniref:Uncharacterized protein n=1 Tax=Caerostris extrusa TaxID=172846 RepID=A0AAV4TRZ6_CAEEX|nr:hypothetical protein CEXT_12371 [Caerostris extrusa]
MNSTNSHAIVSSVARCVRNDAHSTCWKDQYNCDTCKSLQVIPVSSILFKRQNEGWLHYDFSWCQECGAPLIIYTAREGIESLFKDKCVIKS